LRFLRVPAPRRPASLAYPAFFAFASLLVARRRDALLHTTGAVVANRADLSTVHYCHRAAVTQMNGSRASRPGLLYRANSALMVLMALVGEAWCYRPARARLLCAVSRGVAGELTRGFPEMAEAVRTVPNGVDSEVFRPNAAARRAVRAELGIDERVPLALFVGGDWERKGLAHARDALALTPEWHLAVAGPGQAAPHLMRARAAECESRLHFLGRVRDMPRVYAAADAFVFPTAYEAFPLVVLEAAACGLPLLVTRVNGVDELLEEGVNGWFVTRDPTDIASRLNELSADPDRAKAMAESARAAASRFSWDAMTHGYLSLYAELSGRQRTPSSGRTPTRRSGR
jgi:glycosyltransferase involved in cell wall biosynthesis